MKKLTEIMKKREDNKGFTLVELIIVVAIIAVLAAVLAPQYLQYVERSRQSNDLQVATNIMRAATVAVADPMNEVPSSAEYTVTWVTNGTAPDLTVAAVAGTGGAEDDAAVVRIAIAEVMGWLDAGEVSGVDDAQSAAGTGNNFSFEVSVSTGQIELAGTAEAITAWEEEVGVNP